MNNCFTGGSIRSKYAIILSGLCYKLPEPSEVKFTRIIGRSWGWWRHIGFRYLDKAAIDPWPELGVRFSGLVADLLVISPPLPLLPVPHHLRLSLLHHRIMGSSHHHLCINSHDRCIGNSVGECAPAEWHLKIKRKIIIRVQLCTFLVGSRYVLDIPCLWSIVGLLLTRNWPVFIRWCTWL